MTLAIDDSIRNSRLSQVSASSDAGASGALITIYDGAQPSKGGTVTNLLAQMVMSADSFQAPSGGSMSANPITDDPSADAQGVSTWFRLTDSDGLFVLDGTVGLTGSGADMTINNTSFEIGLSIEVTSFVITDGNA